MASNRALVTHDSTDPEKQKYSITCCSARNLRHLINSLKLLTNQQAVSNHEAGLQIKVRKVRWQTGFSKERQKRVDVLVQPTAELFSVTRTDKGTKVELQDCFVAEKSVAVVPAATPEVRTGLGWSLSDRGSKKSAGQGTKKI